MTSRPTGNQRTDAKNSLGLSGIAPVEPSNSSHLPWSGRHGRKSMRILTPGGDPVRATHPGTVGKVEKLTGGPNVFYVVEVVATDGALTAETRKEAAFTRYSNLGSVSVVLGQKILPGQQVGTVSYHNLEGAGDTGIGYQVFKNGYGNASEVNPQSAEGISVIKGANPDGIAPSTDVLLRKSVPVATPDNAQKLSPGDASASTSSVPANGPGSPNPPYVSRPQVNFEEQVNQVYEHDILVFIMGVDVTKYLTESLSISLVDRDGWNEATFMLNNAADNFVITHENLGIDGNGPRFRTGDIAGEDKYSERAKKEILLYKDNPENNPFIDVAQLKEVQAGFSQGIINANVTGFKFASAGNETEDIAYSSRQTLGENSVGGQVSTTHLDRRWPIGYQSAVIHKNDPVRIFRKNPLRLADEWMPAFTGYVENISYDTNYVTGVSNVKITCYDIRAIAHKKRIQTTAVTGLTNPRSIFRGPPGSVDSLFSDLLSPDIVGHPLGSRRFEDVMEFLVTGLASQDRGLEAQFQASGYSRGIGEFTLGDKILYKPGDSGTGEQPDPLEHWHALCLFGSDGRTLYRGDSSPGVVSGASKDILGTEFNRRWLTEAEARYIGKETTHTGKWAPHTMFLHFLLPADGTGAKNLLEFDAQNANSNKIDFRSLLDIMQDFANRIDYQFWVTPMGDIVVEFPQYDFYPRDYGEYKSVFKVNRHLQSDNIQDEAGDMVTAVIAHGRLSPITDSDVGEEAEQPKAVVVAPLMMIRYGVNEQELTLPFISSADSLKRLAIIEFQKKLAESNKMDMDFDYRPFILPNRPIENIERKRMGLTTAVNNQLTLFKTGSTAITTRYVRRSLIRADGTEAYTLITGNVSMPISYRQIYAQGTQGIAFNLAREGGGTPGLAVTPSTPANPAASVGTGITTRDTVVTTQNKSTIVNIVNAAEAIGLPAPMAARLTAMGQQMSSFNPDASNPDTGGFGIFQLREDVREAINFAEGSLGIGNTLDINKQVDAATEYFYGLATKYKGNVDAAIAEFALGAEKIRNSSLVQEFQDGFGTINKELGAKYEQVIQAVQSGLDTLFPGETEVVTNEASEEAQEAIQAAEAEGALPSAAGFQNTMGVVVFDIDQNRARSTTESATETQIRQVKQNV